MGEVSQGTGIRIIKLMLDLPQMDDVKLLLPYKEVGGEMTVYRDNKPIVHITSNEDAVIIKPLDGYTFELQDGAAVIRLK